MWNTALDRLRSYAAAPVVMIASVAAPSAAAMPAAALNPFVSPLAVAVDVSVGCSAKDNSALTTGLPVVQAASYSKSSAILGGEMSALERMKAQQSGAPAPTTGLADAGDIQRLEPAASGVRPVIDLCSVAFSGVERIKPQPVIATSNPDDFLDSKRVRIGKTSFDRDWRRVRSESLSRSQRPNELLVGESNLAIVERVNQWVNHNIKYVEDRDLFGRADYWAGARKTLKIRKGDCEDIALTKMQLLAAAGFSRADMFITIARDTVRRADHALLVVKVDDRYVVLDNATDVVLDGGLSHGYTAILSFAADKSWIHGY